MQQFDSDSEGYTEVFAWGSDSAGQLGLGDNRDGISYNIPKFCSYNIIINMISCGEEHAAFITKAGQIFTMGSNKEGRLGIGNKTIRSSSTPCKVEALSLNKAIFISCGWGHTAVVTDKGELYTWGVGEYGMLGIQDYNSQYSPVKVKFVEKSCVFVSTVSCGTRHTAIVDNKGRLFVCGSGDAGQLGTGGREKHPLPLLISSIPERIASVDCGIFHTLILSIAGIVYATGGNNFGQLGVGNQRSSTIPLKISELEFYKIMKIKASQFSMALSDKGDLFIWGSSVFGSYLLPTKIELSMPVKDFGVGSSFGLIIDKKNTCYSWGTNLNGELGLGDNETRDNPSKIIALEGRNISYVACGSSYSILLGKTNSKLYSSDVSLDSSSQKRKYLKNDASIIKALGIDKIKQSEAFQSNLYGNYKIHNYIEKEAKKALNASNFSNIGNALENSIEQNLKFNKISPIAKYRRDHSAIDSNASRRIDYSDNKIQPSDNYRINNLTRENEKEKLQQELRDEKRQRFNLELKLKQLEQQISYSGLSDKLKTINLSKVSNYDSKSDEIERNKEKITLMNQEIDRLKARLAQVTAHFETIDKSMKETEKENEILKEEIDQLRNEKSYQEESINESNKLHDLLKEYEVKLDIEMKAKHEIMMEKAEEINTLKEIVGDLESKLIQKQEELANLEEKTKLQITYLEEADKSNKEIIECLSNEKVKFQETMKIFEERIEILNQTNQVINSELQSITAERDTLMQSLKNEKGLRQNFENFGNFENQYANNKNKSSEIFEILEMKTTLNSKKEETNQEYIKNTNKSEIDNSKIRINDKDKGPDQIRDRIFASLKLSKNTNYHSNLGVSNDNSIVKKTKDEKDIQIINNESIPEQNRNINEMKNTQNEIIINDSVNNVQLIQKDENNELDQLLPQNTNAISPIILKNESCDISNPIIVSQQLINSQEKIGSNLERQIEESNFISANEAYELGSASEIHNNNFRDTDDLLQIKSINDYYQENALLNNIEEEALNIKSEVKKDINTDNKIAEVLLGNNDDKKEQI